MASGDIVRLGGVQVGDGTNGFNTLKPTSKVVENYLNTSDSSYGVIAFNPFMIMTEVCSYGNSNQYRIYNKANGALVLTFSTSGTYKYFMHPTLDIFYWVDNSAKTVIKQYNSNGTLLRTSATLYNTYVYGMYTNGMSNHLLTFGYDASVMKVKILDPVTLADIGGGFIAIGSYFYTEGFTQDTAGNFYLCGSGNKFMLQKLVWATKTWVNLATVDYGSSGSSGDFGRIFYDKINNKFAYFCGSGSVYNALHFDCTSGTVLHVADFCNWRAPTSERLFGIYWRDRPLAYYDGCFITATQKHSTSYLPSCWEISKTDIYTGEVKARIYVPTQPTITCFGSTEYNDRVAYSKNYTNSSFYILPSDFVLN